MKIKLYVSTKNSEYRPTTDIIDIDDRELREITDQGREDQYINEKAWNYVSTKMIRWSWDIAEEDNHNTK
jgi:hypothetical protein